MKKWKICDKFKKIIIIMMCCLTLVFAMPVKSEAGIVDSLMEIFLFVPDGIQFLINEFLVGDGTALYKGIELKGVSWNDNGRIYHFWLTPYNIFTSNQEKLGLLDVNFFAETTNEKASSQILAPAIGNIYRSLRNLCLILMMLVLLYIGIKIMLSSIASEQAKYKQLLMDWLVGFALLFIMHYIMAFLMSLNTMIVEMLSNDEGDTYYIGIGEAADQGEGGDSTWYDWIVRRVDINDRPYKLLIKKVAILEEDSETASIPVDGNVVTWSSAGKIRSCGGATYAIDNWNVYSYDTETWSNSDSIELNAEIFDPDNDKWKNRVIYKCNLMEYARTITTFGSRFVHVWNDNDNEFKALGDDSGAILGSTTGIAYGVIYIVLVVESIMFLVIYLKRVLQLAFLTMIAPLVSFMYPIDKVGDGKAQAFNTWFKDYLFNILLQPLHLLLYTILINAAAGLVNKNPIYALAVYGYMIPAEKYFKKLFGFDKASTGGGPGLAGAVGAGMAMDGLKRLTGLGLGPGGKPPRGGGDSQPGKRKFGKSKLERTSDGSGQIQPNTNVNQNTAPASSGNNNINNRNKNQNTPNSKGNSRFRDRLASGVKATGQAAGHKISRALTGGKYDRLKGHKGAVAAKLGKKAIRGVGRVAGGLAGASAGLLAGAATAMATGDLGKLTQGLGLGAAAGIKQGKNIANAAMGATSSLYNDYKYTRAENDEEYKNNMRIKEQEDAFDGANLSEDQRRVLNSFAPYVNFDGNEDKLKAFVEASKGKFDDLSQLETASVNDLADIKDSYDESQMFGNINTQEGESDLRNYLIKKESGNVQIDENSQEFKDKVAKKSEHIRQQQLKEAYKQREEVRDKLAEARSERMQKKYQKELEQAEQRLEKAKQTDSSTFRDSARNNVIQRERTANVDMSKIEREIETCKKIYGKHH